MKKFRTLILIGVAFILVACGATNNSSETSSDNVELSLSLWNKEQEPVLREILDDFEQENPNIKVNLELTPNPQYWTKLEAAATGEAMADIVWMNGPNFINYAKNGIIEPIDTYLENSDIDLTNYPDGLVDLYTYENEVYGVPKDWDTTALWFNKEIFDDNNLDYPTSDWTFEDLVAAAEELTDSEKGIWGIAATNQTQEGIYNIIPQNGGYVINETRTESGYDMPETIEAIEKYVGLIEEGLSPTLEVLTDTAPRDLFLSGKLGMVYAASWNIPLFTENEEFVNKIDVVEMPGISQKGATIHGLIYALNSKSSHKDEAFKVIEYLASEEANIKWAESGVVIPAHNSTLQTWIDSQPELNLEAFSKSLEYATPFPISANSSVWNQYESDAINEMYTGSSSVKDALENLATKMNSALESEQ